MSAKGRKRAAPVEVEAYADAEFYPTPASAIQPMLDTPLVALPAGVWIDPCVGTGRIPAAVNASRADVRWLMCDIDERHRPHIEQLVRPGDELLPFGDFVNRPWTHERAALSMFNPPFSLALAFVLASMERADQVLMLQRLNWFGTKQRSRWLVRHCPDVYVLPERPSFTADGGTDSAEYAWFHWPAREERRTGTIAVLDNARQGGLFGGAA